jgi:uroporphyrinogen decarboxylase
MMTHRENLIRAIQRDHPAWVPYRYDGSLTMPTPCVVAVARAGGLDDWGVNWVGTDTPEGSYPDGQPVLTIAGMEDLKLPDTDWEALTLDLQTQVAEKHQADTLVIAKSELILFERARLLLGLEAFSLALLWAPAKLHWLFDRLADYQVQLAHAVMRSGVAGIRFTDDWGIQNSLYIKPEHWRTFIKPRLRRLYRVVKDYGGSVFQHTCGHIEEIVPDLIEIGLDVLDPCQPRSNDIFRWKREYGDRLSFMGGLDTQGYLSFGAPAEVRTAIREVVSVMSRGGGYIAAPSHTITLPRANQQAMIEAIGEVNAMGEVERGATWSTSR